MEDKCLISFISCTAIQLEKISALFNEEKILVLTKFSTPPGWLTTNLRRRGELIKTTTTPPHPPDWLTTNVGRRRGKLIKTTTKLTSSTRLSIVLWTVEIIALTFITKNQATLILKYKKRKHYLNYIYKKPCHHSVLYTTSPPHPKCQAYCQTPHAVGLLTDLTRDCTI